MVDFKELDTIVSGSLDLNVPMKEYTSIRIGGPCICIFTPANADDILKFIDWIKQKDLRYFVMGAGTNLIVRDGGIKHPVIRIKDTFNFMDIIEDKDNTSVKLKAGAGKPISELVKYCADNGLSGIESLTGIPGTLGGAIFMNAGTNDGTISDLIETVTFIERTGRSRSFGKDKMGFGYRVCKALSSSSVVVSAVLNLKKADRKEVLERTEAILKKKVETQPLNYPSCGSVFKNPPGTSAWKLLDNAGMRGVRIRGAKYSELHTNFIINTGSAAANDVLALINAGIEKVKEKKGVKLELEAVILGEQL